jgi:protein-disulfide isomerase
MIQPKGAGGGAMARQQEDLSVAPNGPHGRVRRGLELAATVGTILVCASVLWLIATRQFSLPTAARALGPPAVLPQDPISIADDEWEGINTASVAIIEYSDFECPYCAVFANEVLPAIEKSYVVPGKVLLVFRHLPLEQRHPSAFGAAEAAECAGRQGKFWEMHRLLFQDQAHLEKPNLLKRAVALHLDPRQFDECLHEEARGKIRQDQLTAASLSVSGTPTFFVGSVMRDGRVRIVNRLAGAKPFAEFERVLNTLLDAGSAR